MKNILDKFVKNHSDLFQKKEVNELKKQLSKNGLYVYNQLNENVAERKISQKLYGDSPSGAAYQSLQHRMFDKFANAYLMLDSGYNVQREKGRIIRLVALCRILEMYGLRSIMVPIAKKVINKCNRLDLFYDQIEVYSMLSMHYSIYGQNPELAKKYHDLHNQALAIYETESKVKRAHCTAMQIFITTGEYTQIKLIADEIEKYRDVDSHRITFFYYCTRYIQYSSIQDYTSAIGVIKEGIEKFNSYSFDHTIAKNVLTFKLIYCYLSIGKLAQAKLIIISFLENANQSTHQYYRFKELLFKIHLHMGKIDEAKSIFSYLENKCRKLGDNDAKDRVLLYDLYFKLLNGDPISFKRYRYNFNRLKDNQGEILIPFKIAEICYLYLNDTDQLFDKLESLNQYSTKVIKDPKFNRTRSFIKLITKILLNKPYDLTELSNGKKTSNNGLEIINYEMLLDFLIGQERLEGVGV